MKPEPQDQSLDALLQDWSRTSDVAATRLEKLAQRIVLSAVDERAVVDEPSTRPERARPPSDTNARAWSTRLALALAASLLGVLLIRWLDGSKPISPAPPSSESADIPPELAWLRTDQLDAKRQLLGELNELFDRRVEWFAETSGHLEMDLRPVRDERPPAATKDAAVAVRVLVVSRPRGESTWRIAWALDIVARNEQVVRLSPAAAAGADVEIWAYRLPDGVIHVDSRVTIPSLEGLRLTNATIFDNERPAQVGKWATDQAEYRAYELAASLTPDVG